MLQDVSACFRFSNRACFTSEFSAFAVICRLFIVFGNPCAMARKAMGPQKLVVCPLHYYHKNMTGSVIELNDESVSIKIKRTTEQEHTVTASIWELANSLNIFEDMPLAISKPGSELRRKSISRVAYAAAVSKGLKATLFRLSLQRSGHTCLN